MVLTNKTASGIQVHKPWFQGTIIHGHLTRAAGTLSPAGPDLFITSSYQQRKMKMQPKGPGGKARSISKLFNMEVFILVRICNLHSTSTYINFYMK